MRATFSRLVLFAVILLPSCLFAGDLASLLDRVERGEFDSLRDTTPEVSIVHLQSDRAIPHELPALMAKLRQRGFKVRARLFHSDPSISGMAEDGTYAIHSYTDLTAPKRHTIAKRLKRLLHISGRWTSLTFPFRTSDQMRGIRNRAIGIGNALIGLRLYLEGKGLQVGAPNAVLTGWIFGYLSNAESIYRFKSQGVRPRLVPQGDGSHEIEVETSHRFLALTTAIEVAISSLSMRIAMEGFDPQMLDPLSIASDTSLTTFAKTATEGWIARRYRQAALAASNSDAERERQLIAKAERDQEWIYNVMFPVLNLMQLPLGGSSVNGAGPFFAMRVASNTILAGIGVFGWANEKMGNNVALQSNTIPATDCRTILRFTGQDPLVAGPNTTELRD